MSGQVAAIRRNANDPAARRSSVMLVTTFLVAGVLLIISVRGVQWGELGAAIGRANPLLLVCAAIVLSGSYFARGLRWRIQIRGATPITPLMGFWTAMSGALTNNFLPLRAGEITKPLVTSRAVNVSVGYATAAMLVEHVADIVALVIMTVIAAASRESMPVWLLNAARAFAALGLIGALTLLLLARMERTLGHLYDRLPLPTAITRAISATTGTFVAGLRALRRPADALTYVVLTLVVWLLDILTGLVIASALHLRLSWPQMTLLLVALSLSTAAPSTPANIGVWQFVAVAVLVPFGLARVDALAYIIVFQIVTYGIETMWGLIGLAAIAATSPTAGPGDRRHDGHHSLGTDLDGSPSPPTQAITIRMGIAWLQRNVTRHVHPMAVIGLLSGVLAWLVIPVIGAIVAIIAGHWACWAIVRSDGAQRGKTLASVGLILGYTQIALIVMLVGATRLPLPWT